MFTLCNLRTSGSFVEPFTDATGNRLVCAKCGSRNSFLDEIYLPNGAKTFMCSDTEYCRKEASKTNGTDRL